MAIALGIIGVFFGLPALLFVWAMIRINDVVGEPPKPKPLDDSLELYMESLRTEAKSTNKAEFTVSLIDYSWQIWQELKQSLWKFNQMRVTTPNACPGPSNTFMYTWSKAEHYLECEVFENRTIEFFYRNRETDKAWEEDTTLENGFSVEILNKIALFGLPPLPQPKPKPLKSPHDYRNSDNH
jgi:hypothetical protein